MVRLKARVRNGRLVLDAPTTLPDGAEVELVAVGDDGCDDLDHAELRRALLEADAEIAAGDTVPADEVLARLRAHRSA
jgi:hypothetical protein